MGSQIDRESQPPFPKTLPKPLWIAALVSVAMGFVLLLAGFNEVRLGHQQPPKGGSVYVPPWTDYAVVIGATLIGVGALALAAGWVVAARRR